MNIQILQCAESEIADAMDYYNNQYPGLGYGFAFEIKESLKRILSFPQAWPLFLGKTRKCHINRFPYGVVYKIQEESIVVFAVMHLKQNPKRWEQRLR